MSAAKASVTPLDPKGGAHPIEPDFPRFARRYDEGMPQVAWTRLVADLETPVSAMLKLAHERPNSFLLESVEGGSTRGRYSIIGCEPDLIWRANGSAAEINRSPQSDAGAFAPSPAPALASLRALLAESAITLPPELPPMAAGIFGYMGYDTVRLIERLPGEKSDSLGLPDSILVRPTLIVIFDSVKDEMIVVTPVRPAPGVGAKAAYARAADRLNLALERLEQPLPHTSEIDTSAAHPEAKAATAPEAYMAKVMRAKDYIAAGDIFQVVLSQRFEAPFTLPSFALYRALRRVNPSPFLYYLNFGGFAVVGSSPEILVRVRDGAVTIRPIAGTRPRGATPEEDKALAKELLADAKERAEHLMLLDLGRNDVGRVTEIGSVRVTELVLSRVLQPGDAHRVECRGSARHRLRRRRCADGGISGRHGLGRAESARHGDHRRARGRGARSLCRLRRVFLRRRRDGQLHRAPNVGGQRRHDVCQGRRRHRRRFRPRARAGRVREQGARPVQGRR